MDLGGKTVALYGRFSRDKRSEISDAIAAAGGKVVRDLTHRSDLLVVGAQATSLIASGTLMSRLNTAEKRGVDVYGERSFIGELSGVSRLPATFPIETALKRADVDLGSARILAAFDLITLRTQKCAFGDVKTLETVSGLLMADMDLGAAIRLLQRANEIAPVGRYDLEISSSGAPVLTWEDGTTTLEGQAYLPFDLDAGNIDDPFDEAQDAESEGHFDEAIRLYELSLRKDKKDPLAPYNLGNIYALMSRNEDAVMAYKRAIARDKDFYEAHYNLAGIYLALEDLEDAATHYVKALELEPDNLDALLNLGQLRLKQGELAEARRLFEAFIQQGPEQDWVIKARRAIMACGVG